MVQVWVPLVHSPSRDGQAALEAALEALEALALTLSKTLGLISLALELVLSGAQDCKVLNQNAPQPSGGAQGCHLRTDRCKVAQDSLFTEAEFDSKMPASSLLFAVLDSLFSATTFSTSIRRS